MAEQAPTVPAYELIQWNSPKPINERISGEKYILPDGWKEAIAGVRKIKVSNFGALQHDPATVANAKRFGELTGIEVELLGWAEPPIVAKTVSIFSARSDSVDVLCYDHPTTYAQMVGGGWLHPIDAIWDDPNVWKYYAGPLKAGLTAPDGHIYGSIGQSSANNKYRDFPRAIELMASGTIKVKPLITHRFPLREAQQAFHVMLHKDREQAYKVVLHPESP